MICVQKSVGARARLLHACVWVFLGLVSALGVNTNALAQAQVAATGQLTAAQQKDVETLVNYMEQSCLKGTPTPPNANLFVRSSLDWARDPSVCTCVAKRLRTKLTPEQFKYTKEQFDQFWQRFSSDDVMQCSVPVIKARFSDQCEILMTDAFGSMSNSQRVERLAELGFKDLPTMLQSSCDCVRNVLHDITTEQWISSSMAAYQDYLERKRTGKPAVKGPETPLEKAMGACTKH